MIKGSLDVVSSILFQEANYLDKNINKNIELLLWKIKIATLYLQYNDEFYECIDNSLENSFKKLSLMFEI